MFVWLNVSVHFLRLRWLCLSGLLWRKMGYWRMNWDLIDLWGQMEFLLHWAFGICLLWLPLLVIILYDISLFIFSILISKLSLGIISPVRMFFLYLFFNKKILQISNGIRAKIYVLMLFISLKSTFFAAFSPYILVLIFTSLLKLSLFTSTGSFIIYIIRIRAEHFFIWFIYLLNRILSCKRIYIYVNYIFYTFSLCLNLLFTLSLLLFW